MNKIWRIKPPLDEETRTALKDFPENVAQLLYSRGITSAREADSFFNPSYQERLHDPFLFREMGRAVERIGRAIKNKEKIIVHGDYDADGVCGAAILLSTLQRLGAAAEAFLPHRELDGYGLNKDTVELFSTDGVRLILTCDCGISNTSEIKLAAERGIDVVVTDHHAIPKDLPTAYAIIHPKINGETYPDKTLCGAGVAFKLAQALIKKFSGQSTADWLTFEKKLLDLVAIASVADMVPLTGETRALVKFGLMVINRTPRPGLRKLVERARIKNSRLTAEDLAWRIVPRINAAGRVNHADSALELLLSADENKTEKFAQELENNNLNRQRSTDIMIKEAKQMVLAQGLVSRSVIAVYKETWTAGLVGLIASRLKDEYGKPTLVFSREGEKMVGSGRSMEGFNMVAAIQQLPHFFEKFGGHPQACGFTLKHPDLFENFYEEIDKLAKENLSGHLSAELKIDAEQPLHQISWDFYNYLENFEPFGIGNPAPLFLARQQTVRARRAVGGSGKHLKLLLEDNGKLQPAIGFGLGDWLEKLPVGSNIDLVYELGKNEWRGQRELQIKIVDLKLT